MRVPVLDKMFSRAVGPITATAIVALAPPLGTFAEGRDFAAWVGLTPRQHSTGGTAPIAVVQR